MVKKATKLEIVIYLIKEENKEMIDMEEEEIEVDLVLEVEAEEEAALTAERRVIW